MEPFEENRYMRGAPMEFETGEWNVYKRSVVEEKLRNDEIDPQEAAFTRGYLDDFSET